MIEPNTSQTDLPPIPREWFRVMWDHPVTRIVGYICLLLAILITEAVSIRPLHPLLRRLPADFSMAIGPCMEAVSVLVAAWIMVRFAEHRHMRDIGFVWRGIVTDTMIGAMIGMGAISCTIGILALLGDYRVIGSTAKYAPWMMLLTLLFVGIAEETCFRGFIFRVLEYRYGSLIALISSAAIFGLLHALNPMPASMSVVERLTGPIFIGFEAGMLMTAAYIATRRMWLAIGIHWAWNFFEGPIYGADVSGTSTHSLVKATIKGPFLLSGGAFGPEASIICLIVCTVAGLMLLRVAVRAGQWKPIGAWQPATAVAASHEQRSE